MHPGVEMSGPAAAALAAATPAEADRACGQLLAARLLTEAGLDRYRFHDLARAFAYARAEAEESEPTRGA